MSLTRVSLSSVVFKQYKYKLKAYNGVFMALIVVQVIGILLSLIGMGNSSFHNSFYIVDVSISTSSLVIILTMIWAFMNAILVTTKAYREDDFTFVSNRLSYNLSNIAFLLTACVIGAITALLSTGVIHTLFYFLREIDIFLSITHEVTISDYIGGVIVTILFVLLSATAGYLVGMMAQFNKGLIILLPVILLGINFVAQTNASPGFINILEFYFMENSFSLLFVKILVSIFICCGLATVLSNRLEVRR